MKSSFRFSLGTLMTVVTLACFVFCLCGGLLRAIEDTLAITRREVHKREEKERLERIRATAPPLPNSQAPAPNPPKP